MEWYIIILNNFPNERSNLKIAEKNSTALANIVKLCNQSLLDNPQKESMLHRDLFLLRKLHWWTSKTMKKMTKTNYDQPWKREYILQKTREECSFHFSWWRCEVYSFRHCFVECDIIVCYYSVIYLRVVKIVTFFFRVSDTTCLLPIGYYGCYTLTIRKTDVINQNVLQGIEEHWHVAPIKIILDWQIYKTLKKPPWKKKELYLMEKILLTIFTTKLPSGSTPKFRYSFSVETIDS